METKSTKELLNELKTTPNIDVYLKENDISIINVSLKEHLQNLLKEKHLSKNKVIELSGLNQIYGYQIFSGDRNPSRDKVILIGTAFSLDVSEMQRLLTIAKVDALYPRRQRDSAIIFGINKSLSVMQINELLFDLGEPILE